MDDVLANFTHSYNYNREIAPEIKYPQGKLGFFKNLEPIPGAVESVNILQRLPTVDTYILTAPSTRNPHSYSEKRVWVEKHFNYEFTKKLIICSNKSLLKGDILIDDNIYGKGQDQFEGELIHFGNETYNNWEDIMTYLTGIQLRYILNK